MQVRFGEHILVSGALYTYHVTFTDTPRGVSWHAIVRNETGALRGTPSGVLAGATLDSAEIEDTIRSVVEAAIDSGADVRLE